MRGILSAISTWAMWDLRPDRTFHCMGSRIDCWSRRPRLGASGWGTQIGGINVVLTGNSDQREQGVAARVGQGRTHALGIGSLGNGTDRPIRSDPLARGVGEHGRQVDYACLLVDR